MRKTSWNRVRWLIKYSVVLAEMSCRRRRRIKIDRSLKAATSLKSSEDVRLTAAPHSAVVLLFLPLSYRPAAENLTNAPIPTGRGQNPGSSLGDDEWSIHTDLFITSCALLLLLLLISPSHSSPSPSSSSFSARGEVDREFSTIFSCLYSKSCFLSVLFLFACQVRSYYLVV